MMRKTSTSGILCSVAIALALVFSGIALSSALPCEGFAETTFASAKINVSQLNILVIPNQEYTGRALTPAPVVMLGSKMLKSGTDYTVKYANNIQKGTATVTITGKNLYYGTKTVTFQITAAPICKASISAIPDQVYSASAITPKPVVELDGRTLVLGADYTLAYKNNIKKGTATVTITGKNLYRGTKTVTFKITAAPLCKARVSAIPDQAYSASAITPKPVVELDGKTLVFGADYSIAYKNNVSVGTATATITGKGNFVGSRTVTFKILKANMANATIATLPQRTFTGQPLFPKPVIKLGAKTLVEGTDYRLSYSNNTAGGTASVTAMGIGSMYGSKTATFEIAVPTIASVRIREDAGTGGARLDMTVADFNKVFSFGDAIDVEFSNGYTIENIPFYNGFYAKLGAPLVLSYLGENDPMITTSYGERIWQMAELSSDMTATLRLAGKGTYSAIQDALNITYTNVRADFPTDAAFANFRQVVGGNLNGKLYRSSSPICNWKKRAAYASALAESAGIAFVLNLSDTADDVQNYINWSPYENFDASYYESLFNAGAVEPLNMNSSYSTCEYQQKICAGLAVMAHRDGPYLIHCFEGKDRTGFACLVLGALAGSSYDELLADYMETYANYCFITKEATPERYAIVQSVYFDSMIDFLTNGSNDGDYAAAARRYLSSGGMSDEDIDLLAEKLTGETDGQAKRTGRSIVYCAATAPHAACI